MTGDGWTTTRPVDGAALVAAVNAATGAGLVYGGRLPGGNAGAVAATRPDGRSVVLTRWGPDALARAALISDLVGRLIAAGYPAAAFEVVPVPGGAATVQRRVAGVPGGGPPSARLVGRVLELTDLQAGRADRPAGDLGELHLTTDGDGYCLHEPLRRHSAATRDLVGWVEEVGRAASRDAFRGCDIVHHDLHLGNVLVRRDDPDEIAGVVDWAGVRVGDRALDLVTFGFDVSRRGGDPSPVRDRLAMVPAERRRPYVAHLALRYVDWMIRHAGGADVAAWLAVATDWRTWTA